MKFGFEKEFFVKQKGELCLVPPGVAFDECGFLAEARSEPHTDPLSAVYLLFAAEAELKQQAKRTKISLAPKLDFVEMPKKLAREARRRFGKNARPQGQGNIYGLDYPVDDPYSRAGVHVHFSNTREVMDKDGRVIATVPQCMDIPRIVQTFDNAFKEEIEAAKRLPGFYELKSHGFEYRSLPMSVNFMKVVEVLRKVIA